MVCLRRAIIRLPATPQTVRNVAKAAVYGPPPPGSVLLFHPTHRGLLSR